MFEITPTAIERVAFESETFAQAATRLGVKELVVILHNHPDLHAAWKRGRFLRKIKELAATTMTVPQAAKELGLAGMELRAMLDNDEEVREVWDQQQRQLRMTMVKAMVIQAKEGKPNAVRYVENFLRSEQSSVGLDFQHVPISVMVEITGKVRQTLYAWTRDHGCPRNPDTTYSLPEFFQWYSRWMQDKARAGHLVFQVRKTIREAFRELAETASKVQDTPTKTRKTARQ